MSFSAFLAFPGQGSQHLSMLSKGGIEKIALSSEYSNAIECCSDLISHDAYKLIEEGPEDLINQTSITQPLLVLCSYLHYHQLLNSINVTPTYLAGHSLGEYSALVAANSISITEALKLVRKRGELMEMAPSGSMSAIIGLEKDLIAEIGADAARFYYLSKQADQHLDFDIELAKSQNKENLIFYIQYAHARIASLQSKYLESNQSLPNDLEEIRNGSYTACDKLIHAASKFPGVVERSGETLQPHIIVFYLRDLAQQLHSYYNDNPILKESQENQESILQSLSLVKLVISNGLSLLGIEALEKM